MKTKTAKVNKSKAIRQYLAAAPEANANQVVAGLKTNGIKVLPNHVYNVQAELRKGKSKAARNGKPHQNGVAPKSVAFTVGTFEPSTRTWTRLVSNGESDSVSLIRRTKELAEDCGGWSKLKELVDVLAS